jgi:hypothetical protein
MSLARSCFCIAAWFCFAAVAMAQPMGQVLVVPVGSSDLDASLSATSALEARLFDARVAVIPLHDARDRFTARSRAPHTASESDVDALARAARDAVEHVAFGRALAAQNSVREVITRAERTIESLNRETTTARHILDACLSLVRGALQSGKRDFALEQATRCRRLVPDLMPNEDQHPASVVGVLMEADNLLQRMRIGQLTVTSAPDSGCSVYLNGRHLGTTPFLLERAAAGDYRVQVECNRSLARVHVVQLGDEAATLLVDTQFDSAVVSDPRLLLGYPSEAEARERAIGHAVQLGREIGATDVILVHATQDKTDLLRVHVKQQRLVARAVLPMKNGQRLARTGIDQAIVILAEGRLEGEASPLPTPLDIPEAAPRVSTVTATAVPVEASHLEGRADLNAQLHETVSMTAETERYPRWRLWTGGALALGGAAGIVAGALMIRTRFATGESLVAAPESVALRNEWNDDRRGPLLASGIGAALLTAGFAVAGGKLDLRRHSWIPISTTASGIALLTVGALVVAGNDPCTSDNYPSPRCISSEHRIDRGYQVVVASLPLLAFSAVQLVRWIATRKSKSRTSWLQPTAFAANVSF